jgi:hypothetical protein
VVAACFFTESAPAEEKAEVPVPLEAAPEAEAPPVLDQPLPVPELWAGAEGEGVEGELGADWEGVDGLDVLDQPDEPEEPDEEGGGEDGRVELDQPDEPDRLPPEENEPPDLAAKAAAGPNMSMRATARARKELDRMSASTS